MNKTFIRILLILGIILLIAGILYAGYGIYKKCTLDVPNPVATINIKDYGTIKVELYPDKAPNTVANFIRLANRDFYNGTTFHRTMPNFVIQGGAKDGNASLSPSLSDIYDLDTVLNDKKLFEEILNKYYNGEFKTDDDITINSYSGFKKYKEKYEQEHKDEELEKRRSINYVFDDFLDAQYNIKGEFIANKYNNNNIKHEKGVISMARGDYSAYGYIEEGYNSAGCQFFIMSVDNTQLDGLYAPFGRVIEGMDVVEKVANVKVYYRDSEVDEDYKKPKDKNGNPIESDTPKKQPVIENIKVETYGIDYGVPETIVPFDINSLFSGLYN